MTVTRSAAGTSYLNVSAVALFALGTSTERDVRSLQLGGHDPQRRGFDVQNVELVFDAAIDPYFKGLVDIVLRTDPDGETEVELEEAYAVTTRLPANLQLKAGIFYTELGRLNPNHPHAWDFVDQPLVIGRFLGGDGLRSAGARLSWLMPAPFYSELFIAVQNSAGETLPSFRSVPGEQILGRPVIETEVRALDDMLLAPRYAASFELADNHTLLVGASGAFGPNGSGPDARTSIYAADLFWKWKSVRADRGFPFVKAQIERMVRRTRLDDTGTDPELAVRDDGWYGEAVWGIKPRWTAGVRVDRVSGEAGLSAVDPLLQQRRRVATALTWYPSEYSKLRLQTNIDRRELDGNDRSIWLQLEFLIGAHAGHKF